MQPLQVFNKYAAAFEIAFANDRWDLVEQYFSADITYVVKDGPPLGGAYEGREAVMRFLRGSVEDFDRKFEQRIPEITEGPLDREGGVWLRWKLDYISSDLPLLSVSGVEILSFADGKITRIEDHYDPGSMKAIADMFETYGDRLGKVPGA